MFDDNPIQLTPVSFFALGVDCRRLPAGAKEIDSYPSPAFPKHALPETSFLCHEKAFAEVAMGWNEDGLAFHIKAKTAPIQSAFPSIENGDSAELMIDTRDLKSAGFNTRFCHHFFFLPQAIEGHVAGEVTHFRTEDTHPLCEASDLYVDTKVTGSGYVMKIFIPTKCLHGYDPRQFDRLGFTYRINRFSGPAQHFSVVTGEYPIDQQPSLWSSIKLVA